MIDAGSNAMNRRGIRRSGHISGQRPDVRGLPVSEDVRREVELHIDCRTRELLKDGWEPAAAREEAERLFGNTLHIRRECEQITKEKDRMTKLTLFLQGILHDARYALRTLLRTPLFTSAAILSLAIGIGANTAIFSIVNAVLLRPLPYYEPERIVQIWPVQTYSQCLVQSMRQSTTLFEGIAAFSTESYALIGNEEATDIYGAEVTANYFDVLGVQPLMGRGFLPEEQEPGLEETVILSYQMWQVYFHGDPKVIGQTINLSGQGVDSRTIVGIMPQNHPPLQDGWRFWVPMKIDPTNIRDYVGSAPYRAIGRLREGITVEQADAEVKVAALALVEQESWLRENVDMAGVTPLLEGIINNANGIRLTLLIFMATVILLMLLTCANLANILLARAGGRWHEMAVRAALGAARPRLVRQVITESFVLGIAGGLLGLMAGIWLLSILKGNLPAGTPRTDSIGIDTTILLFTASISVLAAALYGLAPAFATTRSSIQTVLREGWGSTSHSVKQLNWNSVLVAAEISISVLILVGSGLLIRSTVELQKVNPGFEVENLATLRLNPPVRTYEGNEAIRAFYEEVTVRLLALPGVESVSRISHLPLTDSGTSIMYTAEGHPIPEGGAITYASMRGIDDSYFRTMGISILAGRIPDWIGTDPPPRELAVNQAFANLYWEGNEAIGKTVGLDYPFTITGIVGDVHQHSLANPPVPELYIRSELYTFRKMYMLVRTDSDAAGMLGPIQETIRSIDPNVPISYPQPMTELFLRSSSESRTYAVLLTFFGLVAFTLVLIGVFGVVSYTTQQRRLEIGIRMAMGAVRPQIVGEVLRRSLIPIGFGLAIGLGLALASSQIIESMLFGIRAADPMTFAGVMGIQIAVAVLACYIPARRISATDPMMVLRNE